MALLIPGTNGRHRAARVQAGQQDRGRRDGGTAAELGWHSHKNANYGGRNKVRGVEEPLETANRECPFSAVSLQGKWGQVSGSGRLGRCRLVLSCPVVQGRAAGCSRLWGSALGVYLQPWLSFPGPFCHSLPTSLSARTMQGQVSVTFLRAAQRGGGTGLTLQRPGQRRRHPPPCEPAGGPAAAPLSAMPRPTQDTQTGAPGGSWGLWSLGMCQCPPGQLRWEKAGTHTLGRALLICVGMGEARNEPSYATAQVQRPALPTASTAWPVLPLCPPL